MVCLRKVAWNETYVKKIVGRFGKVVWDLANVMDDSNLSRIHAGVITSSGKKVNEEVNDHPFSCWVTEVADSWAPNFVKDDVDKIGDGRVEKDDRLENVENPQVSPVVSVPEKLPEKMMVGEKALGVTKGQNTLSNEEAGGKNGNPISDTLVNEKAADISRDDNEDGGNNIAENTHDMQINDLTHDVGVHMKLSQVQQNQVNNETGTLSSEAKHIFLFQCTNIYFSGSVFVRGILSTRKCPDSRMVKTGGCRTNTGDENTCVGDSFNLDKIIASVPIKTPKRRKEKNGFDLFGIIL